MKCVIRRGGMYLNLRGRDEVKGDWTPRLGIAQVFRTRRAAVRFLASGGVEADGAEVVEIRWTGTEWVVIEPTAVDADVDDFAEDDD